jgi:hypothetical protein
MFYSMENPHIKTMENPQIEKSTTSTPDNFIYEVLDLQMLNLMALMQGAVREAIFDDYQMKFSLDCGQSTVIVPVDCGFVWF